MDYDLLLESIEYVTFQIAILLNNLIFLTFIIKGFQIYLKKDIKH